MKRGFRFLPPPFRTGTNRDDDGPLALYYSFLTNNIHKLQEIE